MGQPGDGVQTSLASQGKSSLQDVCFLEKFKQGNRPRFTRWKNALEDFRSHNEGDYHKVAATSFLEALKGEYSFEGTAAKKKRRGVNPPPLPTIGYAPAAAGGGGGAAGGQTTWADKTNGFITTGRAREQGQEHVSGNKDKDRITHLERENRSLKATIYGPIKEIAEFRSTLPSGNSGSLGQGGKHADPVEVPGLWMLQKRTWLTRRRRLREKKGPVLENTDSG
ncbi:hypothetical protein HPB50_009742 [Hyalomma asiaticum]|uniref:Uncharacterized protein n=1 Tax=Hyalomma asiaticum TaxID=266040 RepID=A0ACB7THF1_HYAAI|nr:hypothetical protein HPB50_009742 [Hyalomma asiaticum]